MKKYDFQNNQKKLNIRKILLLILIIVGGISAYLNTNNPIVNNGEKTSLQDKFLCDLFASISDVEKTLSGEQFISSDTGQPVNGILCDNKKEYIISMKNGYINGMVYTFNKFGDLIVETPYINGKKDGITKVYDNNKVSKILPYKNNKIHGEVKKYYKTGSYIQHYINGKYEGDMVLYDTDGVEWGRVTYKNDKIISGKCAGGRKWSKDELKLWDREIAPYITLSYFCTGIQKK